MTVNRTTLLDLPLPVTGTESGTWGDTTNNGLTQYVDIAIAGMSNLTSANFTAGALTIETTEGDSSATNISATSAQYAGFRVTSLAANSTITVGNTGTSPARSYRLINADATYSLTFKATGQTGVTLLPGQSALVAFNGTDYVIVGTVGAGSTTDNTVPRFDGTTGKILQSSGITIDDSNNVSGVAQLNITTLDATNIEVTNIKAKDGTAAASIADSTGVISVTSNPVLSGGTANGVLYLNGSKVATSGSALTFDGTNFATNTGGTNATLGINSTSSSIYLQSRPDISYSRLISSAYPLDLTTVANQPISFGVNNSEQMRLTSTGLGIGTSSPAEKLSVAGNITNTGVATFGTSGSNTYISLNNNGYLRCDVANWFTLQAGSSGYQWRNSANSATAQMTLDSSGNLGLGVTPSAWSSSWKAFQIGSRSLAQTGAGAGDWTMAFNAVFDSTDSRWEYQYTGDSAVRYSQTGAGIHAWYTAPSGTAGNAITFSQVMTLDASGNLGIGTSSPAYNLDVQGSSSPTIRVRNTSAVVSNYSQLLLETANSFSGLGNAYLRAISMNAGNSSTALAFGVNADGGGSPYEAMRLDQSGNLGLGVTPSAWGGSQKAIQNGSRSVWSTNGSNTGIGLNVYNDGGANRYIANGAANLYQQDGAHSWYTAPSGTAGNAITFTQALTLDSGGNLLLGTTSLGTTYGASAGVLKQTGGVFTERGQFVASGGSTTTITTLANASNNQTYLLSVRQSGAAVNYVMSFVSAYGASSSATRMVQDNTASNLDMNITVSGLTLQLVIGSGFGSTTWDYVLTRIG